MLRKLLFYVLSFCALALGLAGRSSAAVSGKEIGAIIVRAEGDVRVSTGPAAPWEAAEKGLRCGPAASLKTGPSGLAELVFEDGTALRVDPNTALSIETARLRKNQREFRINLLRGRLLSSIVKINRSGRAKYRVRTPVAVAAVRGTVFVVDSSTEAGQLAVFEGAVQTSAQESEDPAAGVEVPANKQIDLKAGAAPSQPYDLTAEFVEYRKNIAELFNKRIESYRQDMGQLRRMHQELMEKRRRGTQEQMEKRQKTYQDAMEEYRKKFAPPSEQK